MNNQAKKNDVYKEKLHQALREYLSWKNSLFKQNILNKQTPEINIGRLFNTGQRFNGTNAYIDYNKLNAEELGKEAQITETNIGDPICQGGGDD